MTLCELGWKNKTPVRLLAGPREPEMQCDALHSLLWACVHLFSCQCLDLLYDCDSVGLDCLLLACMPICLCS